MVIYLVVMLVSGGFEAGMIFAVRVCISCIQKLIACLTTSSQPSYNRGNKAPVNFFGAFSTVLLSVALLYVSMRSSNRARNYTDALRTNDRPQYYEIYKHREVIGISIAFMTVDLLGGVFSDLSLAFKPKFDIIAGVAYSAVVVSYYLVLLVHTLKPAS